MFLNPIQTPKKIFVSVKNPKNQKVVTVPLKEQSTIILNDYYKNILEMDKYSNMEVKTNISRMDNKLIPVGNNRFAVVFKF